MHMAHISFTVPSTDNTHFKASGICTCTSQVKQFQLLQRFQMSNELYQIQIDSRDLCVGSSLSKTQFKTAPTPQEISLLLIR